MYIIKRLLGTLFILLISTNLYGAASDAVSTNSDDFETSTIEDEIYDPFESINRAI